VVDGVAVIPTAQKLDAVAAHTSLGRPGPAVLLVVRPPVVALAFEHPWKGLSIPGRPQIGVDDHAIDALRRPAVFLQYGIEVHGALVVFDPCQALLFQDRHRHAVLEQRQVGIVSEIKRENPHTSSVPLQ
jgi:hypothetical protein